MLYTEVLLLSSLPDWATAHHAPYLLGLLALLALVSFYRDWRKAGVRPM